MLRAWSVAKEELYIAFCAGKIDRALYYDMLKREEEMVAEIEEAIKLQEE